MATKREWLRKIKVLKKEPRPLSSAECDELILLLGGTIRPNHRPAITVFGMNRRQLNFGSIGSVVFGFLENAEQLAQVKSEIQNLSSPDFMKNYLAELPRRWSESHATKMTAKNLAEAVRITEENLILGLAWREEKIARLRPISAKNRAEAERMAAKWFADKGIKCDLQKIQNELDEIRRRAKFKRLGLAEWRSLMAIEKERATQKETPANE